MDWVLVQLAAIWAFLWTVSSLDFIFGSHVSGLWTLFFWLVAALAVVNYLVEAGMVVIPLG